MSDDLQRFHERNMADKQYAVSRQLLDLGEAIARLREESGLTRGQLAKKLRVRARDIVIVEEETPRAPAGLLEAALCLLVTNVKPSLNHSPAISVSVQRIRQLRPQLIPVASS